ncbi:hypothetical protein KEM48_005728 [Puccinia striiformis f. sp. tritici PST-130]|nr:hypothetical protein KEM48_005728 [Puccinia striiformis f. sp. tritici PST-130]
MIFWLLLIMLPDQYSGMESSEDPRNLAGMKVPAVGAPDLQEESPHSLRSTLPTGPFQPTHATSSGSFPGRHVSGITSCLSIYGMEPILIVFVWGPRVRV